MFKQFITKALVVCIVAILVSSQRAYAQINEFKITASDGDADDRFGTSVSIDGNYAVISANFDDDNGSNSGSAYIFHRSGTAWSEQAKLTASDGAANDHFGNQVSISGDYVVIGAYYDDDHGEMSGSAYIFHRSGTAWSEQAKLTASDGAANDFFGSWVSISGDYAVIGAYYDDDDGENSGSAYIFHRSGAAWSEQAKLTASDAVADDRFGCSVFISGDYAVIGAYYDDDDGENSGSAYIFHRSGTAWSEQAKITASDGASHDHFGWPVSISGDYAVIGASFDDDNGAQSGSAYIFHRSGTAWSEQAKITASDGAVVDIFGHSVYIDGDYAVIGAYGDDSCTGSAYIFHRSGTTWTEQTKLTASDGASDDHFGVRVSISGDYSLIAARYDDNENGTDSGSAYIYSGYVVIPSPANVLISIDENIVNISWDEVASATYNVYSSSDPYVPFENWTQEATGITTTSWSGTVSENRKFFCVTAE